MFSPLNQLIMASVFLTPGTSLFADKEPQKEERITTHHEAEHHENNPSKPNFHEEEKKTKPFSVRETLKQKAIEFRQIRDRHFTEQKSVKHPIELKASFNRRREEDRTFSKENFLTFQKHHSNYRTWFNDQFFNEHHFRPSYWRSDVNWWIGAPPAILFGWLGWNSQLPIYYSDGYPVGFESGVNRDAFFEDGSSFKGVQGDWLPLGVFALGSNRSTASNSTIFIQLAINHEGTIAGTYYNSKLDLSFPIDGYVDPKTQEVYLSTPSHPSAPQIAVGLYNLSQNVASIQLAFPNGDIQNWVAVKLQ